MQTTIKRFFLSTFLITALLISPLQTNAENLSITQDDWSGGSGQATWEDETKFSSEEGEGLYTGEGLKMKINADTVVGQNNFDNISANSADPKQNSLYSPQSSFYDGNKFFVADTSNNRVLIYNSLPTENSNADVVIGQADFVTNSMGTSATKFNYPKSVYSDGSRLLIADRGNNRILVYNTIPTENGVAADVVIGQENFVTGTSGTSSAKINRLEGISSDGTKLFIADSYNNRILIYNSIPTTNGAEADVVIGQDDFDSSPSGLSNIKFSNPYGVYYDGTKLFVLDGNNNRILIYNSIPTENGASADVVIGQDDFDTNSWGTSSTRVSGPSGVYSDGTKLFIVSEWESRVLIYNSIPTSNGAAANVVVGQTNFTATSPGASSTKLYYPKGVYAYGGKLFISDSFNNRILVYNSIPTTNGAAANLALGQTSLTGKHANQRLTRSSEYGFDRPTDALVVDGKLVVMDSMNSRIPIFDSIPSASGTAANKVLGWHNFTDRYVATTDHHFSFPENIYSDGTKFYLSDPGNSRILIYNSMPNVTGAAADVVVGQTDFTTYAGGTSSTKMNYPAGVYSDGAKLFVVDYFNNRVLIYNSIPTANGAAADVVIGQDDFTTNASGTSSTKLSYPKGIYSDGTKLFISDSNNNRVLIYNSIPTANGAAADVVIGQDDFVTSTNGTSNRKLNYPRGIYSDGTRFFIADQYNHRILIYNSIPTTNGAEADALIGQDDFNSKSYGSGKSSIYAPTSFSCANNRWFLSDFANNRVLIFNSSEVSSTLTSSTFTSESDQDWGPISFQADTPDYTDVKIEVAIDGNSWREVNSGDSYIGRGKTMAYKVTLISKDGISTPNLQSISFGQAAKDDTGIFSVFKNIFNDNDKLKTKNNETFKISNKTPKIKGEEPKLKNGKIEVYYDNKIRKEILIDENGKWNDKLKFKNGKSYTLTFKYLDEFNTTLKTENIKIKVDSEKPEFKDETQKNKNQTITHPKNDKLIFSAKDSETDIDYYRIKLLDSSGHKLRDWKKQKDDSYLIPEAIKDKASTVLVRAYDEVGNYSEVKFDLVTKTKNQAQAQTRINNSETIPVINSTEKTETSQPEQKPVAKEERKTETVNTNQENNNQDSNTISKKWWNPLSWF